MLDVIGVVLRKELTDSLRDRRTIINTMLSALLGPLMLAMLLGVISQVSGERADQPLELPVAGAEAAPDLMAFLAQSNVVIRPAPTDPEAAVRAGDLEVALVIGAGYAERRESGLPAPLRLIFDSSRQSAAPSVQRANDLLDRYGRVMAALRLQARGVSPSLISPVAIEQVDTATDQSRAAQLLNVMPYFIIFAIFLGGMGLTIDVTAGERERGSLEPLLINPVGRGAMVLGKLLASLVPTAVNVFIALVGFAAVVNLLPIGERLGVRLSLGFGSLAGIFLVTVPMMLLATALQMIIAVGARTVKEAQSYLGFLPLVPALPGLFLAFVPIRPALWMMAIPTFGQQLLINQLMRGEPVDPLFVTVSAANTLAVGVVLTIIATRLFGREAALFGRS
jgi:sodium transport system permease protein